MRDRNQFMANRSWCKMVCFRRSEHFILLFLGGVAHILGFVRHQEHGFRQGWLFAQSPREAGRLDFASNAETGGRQYISQMELDEACECFPPVLVLYQDDNLLVIDKPSGIPHHNEMVDRAMIPGILSVVRHQLERGTLVYQSDCPKLATTTPYRLYGVHRLDKATSGVLMFAKNIDSAKALANGFRNKQIVKYYTGLSWNKPKKKKQGLVQGLLQRGRRKSWYLSPGKVDDSKKRGGLFCQTRFYTAGLGHLPSVLGDSHSNQARLPKTLILFRPLTGRTHQLRVAAKSVGLALAGDPIYSTAAEATGYVDRTCLHATVLHIPHSVLPSSSSLGREGVTIWSNPKFASWYATTENGRGMESSLLGLIGKHAADFPEIQRVASLELNSDNGQESVIQTIRSVSAFP